MAGNIHKAVLVTMVLVFLMQCATTDGYRLRPEDPRIYNNTYQEVIDASEEAIHKAGLNISAAEERAEDTYYIVFYREKYLGSSSVSALKAELTIQKLEKEKVKVTVDENEPPETVTSAYREHVAKDFYDKLDPILNLVPPTEPQ